MAPVAVRQKGEVYDLFCPGWLSTYQGVIDFPHSVCLKLPIERPVGLWRAGQHKHTAGVTVQAVHDPQPTIGRFQDLQHVDSGRVPPWYREYASRFVYHQ
jgi:hypothetical protein